MLVDIIGVRPLGGHRLWLQFEDGVSGEVDLATVLEFEGVFAPLADIAAFACVQVDAELGTIRWPGGADLAPEMLYERVISGKGSRGG